MRKVRCDKCGRSWGEADTEWDKAAASRKCPYCSSSLHVESVDEKDLLKRPQEKKENPVEPEKSHLASQWARLGNFIIDSIAITGISAILYCLLVGKFTVAVFDYMGPLIPIVGCFYYIIFEYLLNRTPGKIFTGTRVVSITGERLSLAAIVLRTISRLLPIEWISFSHSHPRGWHDRFGESAVVNSSVTQEEIQRIDFRVWKQSPLITALACIGFLYPLIVLYSSATAGFAVITVDSQRNTDIWNFEIIPWKYFDLAAEGFRIYMPANAALQQVEGKRPRWAPEDPPFYDYDEALISAEVKNINGGFLLKAAKRKYRSSILPSRSEDDLAALMRRVMNAEGLTGVYEHGVKKAEVLKDSKLPSFDIEWHLYPSGNHYRRVIAAGDSVLYFLDVDWGMSADRPAETFSFLDSFSMIH